MAPDDLWLVAPKDFVAARNALVKELRAAKQRDEATEVAAMRRPAVEDWALNVTIREGGDEGDAFVAAARAAQEAQADAAAGDGAGLRPALDRLRQADAALTKAATAVAARLGEGSRHRVAIAARLRAVAADPAALDLLAEGRLAEVEATPDDAVVEPRRPKPRPARAAAPAPPRVGTAARAEPAEPAETPTKARAAPSTQDRAAKRAAERLEAASAAAAAATASLESAQADVAAAQAEVDERTAAVTDAQAEVDRAAEALTARKDELAAARRALTKVTQVATRAERVAEQAEADLRKISVS